MLTKTQALQTMLAEDLAAVKAGESKIDQALRKYDGSRVIVYLQGTSRKALDKLCEMYSSAGWKTAINQGDQRDPGPWIELS